MPPKFTMGQKLKDPMAREVRPGPYTTGNYNYKGEMTTPAWTLNSRSTGISKPPQQPGPGEYTLPSTLYGSHPQLPVPGRIPKSTTRRSLPNDGMPTTPAPWDYAVVQKDKFGRIDQTTAPRFTMRGKLKDPMAREQRPGPYETGNYNYKGEMTTPSWTLNSRSTGISKPPQQPGPGEYTLPSTLYGCHPQLPVPGRIPKTTAPRFPELPERPY